MKRKADERNEPTEGKNIHFTCVDKLLWCKMHKTFAVILRNYCLCGGNGVFEQHDPLGLIP